MTLPNAQRESPVTPHSPPSSPPSPKSTLTIALIGNPNTGKSTLFSALAGVHQRTGNYPGVTVEKRVGHTTHDGRRLALVDLPGAYSLAPRSMDEMVAVDVLLGRRNDGDSAPDAVLCVIDASNVGRNLYLTSQVLELGLPAVIALNMTDVARDKGIVIDVAKLSERIGAPIIEVQANRKRGVAELKAALVRAAERGAVETPSLFPEEFRQETDQLSRLLESQGKPLPRYLIERLLLDVGGYVENLVEADAAIKSALGEARARLEGAGIPVPHVEAMARYGWVGEVTQDAVIYPKEKPTTWGDRIDRILTHKVGGTILFAALMLLIFMAIFHWATIPMDWIDLGFAKLQDVVNSAMPAGALRSLIADGVIAGAGGVIVFLPQIMILFFFLAILEDCGYLARAAYLMDKLMLKIGLSGKSFIPLLSAHACAIPGVMATRVIEDPRDRLATMLVTPLMSCSARLPVYLLLIGAFIPKIMIGGWLGLQPLTMFAMYALGILTAAGAAFIFKRTILKGPTPPFMMELPSYKWPSPTLVARRMADEGWRFIQRAGTLIVAVSIVVWALLHFPRDPQTIETPYRPQIAALQAKISAEPEGSEARAAAEKELTTIENQIEGAYQRNSALGRLGRAIEPAVKPLGWDWRIGCAVIASFPAREVVVGVLGVIYNLGEVDPGEEDARNTLGVALREARDDRGEPVFTVASALSLLVFFSLCSQCAATLAVIRRETNTWKWPLFTFAYMTALAYAAALAVYQIGSRLF